MNWKKKTGILLGSIIFVAVMSFLFTFTACGKRGRFPYGLSRNAACGAFRRRGAVAFAFRVPFSYFIV